MSNNTVPSAESGQGKHGGDARPISTMDFIFVTVNVTVGRLGPQSVRYW